MRYLYYLFLLFIFCSCESNSISDDKKGYKRYYADKRLEIEQSFKPGDIEDGFYRYYFQSGQLQHEILYENGKKYPTEKIYYENGKLKSINYFNKKGLEDSIAIWYYPSGAVSDKHTYLNGRAFGNIFSYYESGAIKEYQFAAFNGKSMYQRQYDSLGAILKENGSLTFILYDDDSLNIGDTFKSTIYLISPPKTSSKVTVTIFDNKRLVEKISLGYDDFKKTYYGPNYFYDRILSKAGDYKINVSVQMYDTVSNKIQIGNQEIPIYVQ